ncbi:hypothetical protein D3C87_1657510 [compost metagenome]
MHLAAALLHTAFRACAPRVGGEELRGVVHVAAGHLVIGEADHVLETLAGDEDRHGFAQGDLRVTERGPVIVAGKVGQ